jgi:glutamyl-tRNA reductase
MTDRELIRRLEERTRSEARRRAERIGTATARAARATAHVCGINHTRASLEVLERYALSPEAAEALLRRLVEEMGAGQAMVLSTCNRTEIYGWSEEAGLGGRLREALLGVGEEAEPEAGPPPLYEYRGVEAVRHLFAVESGLDSMILGENHIKAQVRRAWVMSQATGAAGAELNRTVQGALRCGKRIRTETGLNEGTLECDMAAILKGERELGTLEGKTCLVIGAGKIGRRSARAIAERRPARLLIVNRTVATAREIADACCGEAHGLEALEGLLPTADFVLGAAYAAEFVVRREAYAAARADGGATPAAVCMVDTAVPRIFDPALGDLEGVRLFSLEQMQEIVESNRQRRLAAAQEGWRIVEEEIERHRAAEQQAELAPAIERLKEEFDRIFEQERSALEMMADSPAASRKLEAVQERIKQRLLHEVIVEMKERLVEE